MTGGAVEDRGGGREGGRVREGGGCSQGLSNGGCSQGLSNEFAAMRSEAGQCALKGVKAVSRYCPSSQRAVPTLTCLTGPVCSLLGLRV